MARRASGRWCYGSHGRNAAVLPFSGILTDAKGARLANVLVAVRRASNQLLAALTLLGVAVWL